MCIWEVLDCSSPRILWELGVLLPCATQSTAHPGFRIGERSYNHVPSGLMFIFAKDWGTTHNRIWEKIKEKLWILVKSHPKSLLAVCSVGSLHNDDCSGFTWIFWGKWNGSLFRIENFMLNQLQTHHHLSVFVEFLLYIKTKEAATSNFPFENWSRLSNLKNPMGMVLEDKWQNIPLSGRLSHHCII